VHVLRLVTEGTLEEPIDAMIERQRALLEEVVAVESRCGGDGSWVESQTVRRSERPSHGATTPVVDRGGGAES
jgi:SNF2 family DNA or RNA helicase